MQNGICFLRFLDKCLESLVGRENQQFNFSAPSLAFHLGHHRKRAISSRADYEALALPGHLLLDRYRACVRTPRGISSSAFPALANLAAVDNHIMFETNAINFD